MSIQYKSILWEQVKQFGNTLGLSWNSSVQKMSDYINLMERNKSSELKKEYWKHIKGLQIPTQGVTGRSSLNEMEQLLKSQDTTQYTMKDVKNRGNYWKLPNNSNEAQIKNYIQNYDSIHLERDPNLVLIYPQDIKLTDEEKLYFGKPFKMLPKKKNFATLYDALVELLSNEQQDYVLQAYGFSDGYLDQDPIKEYYVQTKSNVLPYEFKFASPDQYGRAKKVFANMGRDLPYDVQIVVFKQDIKKISGKQYVQSFRLGEMNCLFNPIKQKIQKKIDQSASAETKRKYQRFLNNSLKLEQDFENSGATPELIQQLADSTLSTIKIYDVISKKQTKYKQQKQAHSQFKFKFMNTKFNHVDLWDVENLDPTYISVKAEEKDLPYEQWTHMYEIAERLSEQQMTYSYRLFNGMLVQIDCGLKQYICEEYNKLKKQEDKINNDFRNLSININRRAWCNISKLFTRSGQFEFIQMGQYQSGRVALKQRTDKKLDHIDIKSGYTQYIALNEEYRMGFPYITDFRKVSDINFCLQYNGLYLCKLRQIPDNLQWIYQTNKYYVLISPILKYLKQQQVEIQVFCGMYGKNSEMVELQSLDSIYGKKAYYTATSKWSIDKDYYLKDFMCFSEEMTQQITHDFNQNDISHTSIFKKGDNDYTQVIHKPYKDYKQTKAHLYAYILQYQQLNMMQQIQKMDYSKIYLICGDDIYYQPHSFDLMPIFRKKEENKYHSIYNMLSSQYKFNPTPKQKEEDKDKIIFQMIQEDQKFLIAPLDYEDGGFSYEFAGEEQKEYHQYQLWNAPGGFGKSHRLLADRGQIDQVYITLMNGLVREWKNSEFKPKAYTKDMYFSLLEKFEIVPANTLIIDEIGLVQGEALQKIKEKYPFCKVYCLGDELQLRNECRSEKDIDPFKKSQYDLILDESHFKIDYRAKNCVKLQELKQLIRKQMREGYSEQSIYFNMLLNENITRMTKQEFISQYNNEQLIVTCSNIEKDKWTDRLKDHKKYRVQKTFTYNGQTFCTGDILTEIPEGFDYEKQLKNKLPYIIQQQGYTAHSLQGRTHANKLFISKPLNIEDCDIFKGYMYTAVSRLKKITDIICLK